MAGSTLGVGPWLMADVEDVTVFVCVLLRIASTFDYYNSVYTCGRSTAHSPWPEKGLDYDSLATTH